MPGRMIPLSEVDSKPIEWLWEGRIPLGGITIVDGKPGTNKSTLLYDLAARVSTDRPMPLAESTAPLGSSVLIFEAEDPATRVKEQIELANGDLSRVFIHDENQADKPSTVASPIFLPDDVEFVREKAMQHQAKLVIFDPLKAFVKGTMNSDKVIEPVMDCLKRLAAQTGAAVVLLRHLRKNGAKDPLYAGVGSIQILAATRSALLVAERPGDPQTRVVAQSKSTFAPKAAALVFVPVKEQGGVRVNWRVGTSAFTAADLLEDGTPTESSALLEAMQFLVEVLGAGPRLVGEVKQTAKSQDISDRTLRRARQKLGVLAQRTGFGPQSVVTWELPLDNEMVRLVTEVRVERPFAQRLIRRRRRSIDPID